MLDDTFLSSFSNRSKLNVFLERKSYKVSATAFYRSKTYSGSSCYLVNAMQYPANQLVKKFVAQ